MSLFEEYLEYVDSVRSDLEVATPLKWVMLAGPSHLPSDHFAGLELLSKHDVLT